MPYFEIQTFLLHFHILVNMVFTKENKIVKKMQQNKYFVHQRHDVINFRLGHFRYFRSVCWISGHHYQLRIAHCMSGEHFWIVWFAKVISEFSPGWFNFNISSPVVSKAHSRCTPPPTQDSWKRLQTPRDPERHKAVENGCLILTEQTW